MTLTYESDLDILKMYLHLDLDPMTLTYESDLDILKMYLHTKTVEVSGSWLPNIKSMNRTDTDRRDQTHYQATFAGYNRNNCCERVAVNKCRLILSIYSRDSEFLMTIR